MYIIPDRLFTSNKQYFFKLCNANFFTANFQISHFIAKKRIDYILQIIKNISQNSNSSILYRKKKIIIVSNKTADKQRSQRKILVLELF